MNSRTRLPTGRTEKGARKKARISASSDEIELPNQTGTSNLEAEQKPQPVHAHADNNTHSQDDEKRTLGQSLQQILNAKSCEEMQTSKPGESKKMLSYYQGMFVYCNAIPLSDSFSGLLYSAIVFFNIGLRHVINGEYVKGKTAFETSLLRLEVPPDQSSPILEAIIHQGLGFCYYSTGDDEDAMLYYKKALFLAQSAGLQNFLVASVINSIGVLLIHRGASDFRLILNLFKFSLSVYQTRFGAELLQIATILSNIGRACYLNGNYRDALLVYQESLSIRRRSLSEESTTDLAATVCNIGQTYHQLGKLESAMEIYREFLDLANLHLELDNRGIVIAFTGMAQIHQQWDEPEDARCFYEKALQAARHALGAQHPDLESTLLALGDLHFEMQDLDQALKYYNEVLEVGRIDSDASRSRQQLITTLNKVAKIHRHQGNYLSALMNYSEVYSLQLESLGPNHFSVAEALSGMGLMQYQLKAYELAFDLLQEALRIKRDHYGSDDTLDVAWTLNLFGLVSFYRRMFHFAMSCFMQSLRIRRQLLGDHAEVAIVLYNIGSVYLEQGDDDEALKLFKETIRVERKSMANIQDLVLTLQHCALVHQQRGELDEALNFFEEALELERAKKEPVNRMVLGKLLNLVGNIHLQKANVDIMMDCYTEASRIYREAAHPGALVIVGYNFYGMSKTHPPSAALA